MNKIFHVFDWSKNKFLVTINHNSTKITQKNRANFVCCTIPLHSSQAEYNIDLVWTSSKSVFL